MKNNYIIACTTAKDAEQLFRALEMIGFKWDANVFNIDNNYCWDVHRIMTQYKISNGSISFGTMNAFEYYWSELGFTFCTADVFVQEQVKLRHRIKYWFKKQIERL